MTLSNFYASSKLKPFGLERLFEKVFSRMLSEMKLLTSAFYSYENGEAKKDVFSIIERTWVGIFSQSIAKAYPELPLIQEFSVWDARKKCIGRCDLLIRWENQNKKYDIIFEAKQCESTGKWNYNESEKFYAPIAGQGKKYYEAESDFYPHTTIIVPLVFEWIRNEKRLTAMKNTLDQFTDNTDPHTHFIQLLHNDVSGVVIYGNIREVNTGTD